MRDFFFKKVEINPKIELYKFPKRLNLRSGEFSIWKKKKRVGKKEGQ